MTEKKDKKQLEKRARRLYTLWKVLLGLFSIGVSIYMAYQEVFNGVDIRAIPSPYLVILCAILAFVFVPILLLVRKWAKESGAEELYRKANKQLWIDVICIVGALIANILGFFIPGLFT